jgi:hypothetical protein
VTLVAVVALTFAVSAAAGAKKAAKAPPPDDVVQLAGKTVPLGSSVEALKVLFPAITPGEKLGALDVFTVDLTTPYDEETGSRSVVTTFGFDGGKLVLVAVNLSRDTEESDPVWDGLAAWVRTTFGPGKKAKGEMPDGADLTASSRIRQWKVRRLTIDEGESDSDSVAAIIGAYVFRFKP